VQIEKAFVRSKREVKKAILLAFAAGVTSLTRDQKIFGKTETGKILVGTASWSDPGFVERWYPKRCRLASGFGGMRSISKWSS